MIDRESTDLPEPDSPTMPSVLPRSSENDTPSTARTSPRSRLEVRLDVVDLEQRAVERRVGEPVGVGRAAARAHIALSRTSKRARTTSPR